jgi:UDP-GlcNAc:undecaprenyl-phosphate GlcNAc-1-phosphate transferase
MAPTLLIPFVFILPIALGVLLFPKLIKIARRVGLMDHPGGRKVHSKSKPLVGGLGMAIVLLITCLLLVPLAGLRGYWAGMALLVLVGFLDDFKELSHQWKFAAQFVAVVCMIFYSDLLLKGFGNLLGLGEISFGLLSVPITIFCVVGVINAINMIDGLDGLAGSVALVAFAAFAFIFYWIDKPGLMLVNIALTGSLAGFLVYNWQPARLFMGDAGSLFLGFSLAFMAIAVSQTPGSRVYPVVPLLILSLPIVDALTLMTKRLLNGKNPFRADKQHLHHMFMRIGLSKQATVVAIICFSTLMATIAIAGVILEVPEPFLFYFFLTCFAAYFAASFFVKDMMKVTRKKARRKVRHTSAKPAEH